MSQTAQRPKPVVLTRLLRLLLVSCLSFYLVICVAMAVFQRIFIYYPSIFTREQVDRMAQSARLQRWTNSTGQLIEDIEAWIRLIEKEKSKRYLTIIDIPSSERKFAMRDLAYMGVTAATLFPRFNGACRSLKERFFLVTNI